MPSRFALNTDYAKAVWDTYYRAPNIGAGDVCVYPLARNHSLVAVAVASEAVPRLVRDGDRAGPSITLRDLAIRPLELA